MNFVERTQLVDALLNCSSVSTPEKRNVIVEQLPKNISASIQTSQDARSHLVNIVNSCENFSNGIHELLQIVRYFEKGSEAITQVNTVWAKISLLPVVTKEQREELNQILQTVDINEVALKEAYDASLPKDKIVYERPFSLEGMLDRMWEMPKQREQILPIHVFLERLAVLVEQSIGDALQKWVDIQAPLLGIDSNDVIQLRISVKQEFVTNQHLIELVNLFVRLYGEVDGAKRVAYDAGLDVGSIDFYTAVDYWMNILAEAKIQNKISSLIIVAQNEYPKFTDWSRFTIQTVRNERWPGLQEVREILAELYPEKHRAMCVCRDARINVIHIEYSSRAITNWHNILIEAQNQNKLYELARTAFEKHPELTELEMFEALLGARIAVTDIFVWLQENLAQAYLDEVSSERIANDAGIDSIHVEFSSKPIDNWRSILEEAQTQGKVQSLLDVVLAENVPQIEFTKEWVILARAKAAVTRYQQDFRYNLNRLSEVMARLYSRVEESRRIVEYAGVDSTRIGFRSRSIDNWKNIFVEAEQQKKVLNIVERALEEYEHQATLRTVANQLATAQREINLLSGYSIARIVSSDRLILGFGSLIANNIFITSYRIFPTKEAAKDLVIQFNHRQYGDNNRELLKDYKLAPHSLFLTSDEGDWTAVGIESNSSDSRHLLDLNDSNFKVQEPLHFLQLLLDRGVMRPSPDPGVITELAERHIHYITNRHPGLPGSPLFDGEWRLIGLHHHSEIVNERYNRFYFRNEAIRIGSIIKTIVTNNGNRLPANYKSDYISAFREYSEIF